MMESSKLLLGALIFIVVVVGINLVMYAMVRGAFRPGKGGGFLDSFSRSLTTTTKQKESELDELRQRVEALKKSGKEEKRDPEA